MCPWQQVAPKSAQSYNKRTWPTYLGAEAVARGANPGGALLRLEPLQSLGDDGVDSLGSVRVLAVRALLQPLHDVDLARREPVLWELVAVEEVGNDAEVSVGSVLVGNQLAVGPDAEDVGKVEDGSAALGF